LKARQTKYAAYAAVYILVFVCILVIANVLADRYDKSFDSTSNKRYSLSDQTQKIVKGLKENATILYFDKGGQFRYGKDQLDPYSNLSSKVHVEYVDPDKKPNLARELGIKSYGTAVVEIGTKHEEAKTLNEEGITGAFIRLLKNKTRTVCFLAGSGEHQIGDTERDGYSQLKELLGTDEYASKEVSLLQQTQIPADCTVLVVGGPRGDYQQPEVDAIKKFVEDGGRGLFMLDPPLKLGRTEQVADNDALTGLLQSWGVTLDKDLILDQNPIGQLAGLGPQVALVTNYGSQTIVNDLKRSATGFPISRSLDIKGGGKTTVDKLFSTSETSFATDKLNSPSVDPSDPKNRKGPLTLGAAGTYNTGKENSQGRFVVIGSSSWVANSFLRFNGNRDLALNTMNWLASDEDLISIRPKDREDRRIMMTQAQFSWVRITSQFLLPLLVVVAGITVWWRRR
jgi:ABC-type uncharacterized transport system involved in gliding motility auxiliary subunit